MTQEWLATSTEPEACSTGGYWHHQQRQEPHRAALDQRFQDELHAALAATNAKGPLDAGLRVGDTGLEPVTSALSRRRSPS